MKIAITCDQLVERRPVHQLVQMACKLFPTAVVYTLVHQKGKVLGPIEHHSIRSTFLSNTVENLADLEKKYYLIPSALKKLPVPCSYDVVIHFSSGLSHCFPTCEKSKVFTYLMENNLETKPESFMGKVFHALLNSLSKKELHKLTNLVSSKELIPFFDLDDWKNSEEKIEKSVVAINGENFSRSELEQLGQSIKSSGLTPVVYNGPLSESFETLENSCSGELVPLFKKAVCSVHHPKSEYPISVLESWYVGCPALCSFSDLSGQVLPPYGVVFYDSMNSLISELSGVISSKGTQFNPGQMRLYAQKYSEQIFKAKFLRKLTEANISWDKLIKS